MSNVFPLGDAPKPNEPNPDVVALLEQLLQRAKDGDISDVLVSFVQGDGTTGNAVASAGPSQAVQLIGSMFVVCNVLAAKVHGSARIEVNVGGPQSH
jgi:hypothetical protein